MISGSKIKKEESIKVYVKILNEDIDCVGRGHLLKHIYSSKLGMPERKVDGRKDIFATERGAPDREFFIDKYETRFIIIQSKMNKIIRLVGVHYYLKELYLGYAKNGKIGTLRELRHCLFKKFGSDILFNSIFQWPTTLINDLILEKIDQDCNANDYNWKNVQQLVHGIKNKSIELGTLGDVISSRDFGSGNKACLNDILLLKCGNEEIKLQVKALKPGTVARFSTPSTVML